MADETTPATTTTPTAISTYKVFLMIKNNTNYEKLIDIKSFPDLGGEPEMLEKTTLSDIMQTYIEGIQKADALAFDANYNPTDYAKIKALKGHEKDLAVWFGGNDGTDGSAPTPTGVYGKFSFKGFVTATVKGGGVNEVVGMTVNVTPSSVISHSES